MPEKYKPPPFNYCDYRCERCEEQENCRVYKEDQERILKHYSKGEDPYDPKVIFNDVSEILHRTKDMLKKDIEKYGINLDEISKTEVPESKPEDYVIYQLAEEYYKKANALIKELERTGIPETISEKFEDLIWYHTLIVAKTGRLVSGFDDDLENELSKIEEEGTLKVINKAIALSRTALDRMLNELPDHFNTIINLLDLLNRLEKELLISHD